MGKKISKSKRLHHWPGFILAFFFLYYGLSGILLNHRGLISHMDVSRSLLPSSFEYDGWNNAALKGDLKITDDSILIYGSVGVWATNKDRDDFQSLNGGFPNGVDHRKVNDVCRMPDGTTYAATQFGLYRWNQDQLKWILVKIETDYPRFVGLTNFGDTIYVINRNAVFYGVTKSEGNVAFEKVVLKAPSNYEKVVSLFTTVWELHSGALFGIGGVLFVDFLGILLIIISVTGIVFFMFPDWIKRRKRAKLGTKKLSYWNRVSIQWHNKIGVWCFVLFILLTFTGMFLRPPLIITIASSKVAPIPGSHLDQDNPWFDNLRDIHYSSLRNEFVLASSKGIYRLSSLDHQPIRYKVQPPVSVMGINVLEEQANGSFLIGSFSGLFVWSPESSTVMNYVTRKVYIPKKSGRPVGDQVVTGLLHGEMGERFIVDYFKGVVPSNLGREYSEMPESVVRSSPISLWSLCLEIHTGRIFRDLLGDFYILIVPLSGMIGISVFISGFILWWRKYRKKKHQ
ncbi:PepSY domain-containing protein [Halosquirtibacter xylanolyticus]|uniref:PepSY-associated TM helix domain-containing protein n=1 Tax=Halosquirtibacter xylanolyticus TaxID=3374599 RepID=UPI003747C1CA|nr:PepSY domain-containing protein [Prolixibacteraceae bacterium]